jgi:hypothetical protein
MKYTGKNEAGLGAFNPFPATDNERAIMRIQIPDSAAGDRITLKIEVGWLKPLHLDLGELEVIVRRGALDGPIVYWTQESCMTKARFVETIETTGSGGPEWFYLAVRSVAHRAYIIGPFSLLVKVYD